ncbi:MAG: S24 family peptidase, partial [Alphaproteobacteria bacterium]|nr:S24 family peptidase [Alphaproteobacteria bacterium]
MATYTGGNTTGFVSPAGDSLETRLDLAQILDLSRPSRYPVRVSGDALA